MDISKMMVSETRDVEHRGPDDALPQDLDTDVDDVSAAGTMGAGSELSAVERIRRYRDGTLEPPMVRAAGGYDDDNEDVDNAVLAGTEKNFSTGDSDNGTAGPASPDSAMVDDDDADAAMVAEGTGAVAGQARGAGGVGGVLRRVPRKAVLIAVPVVAILVVVGVVIPGRGGHDPQQSGAVAEASLGGAPQGSETAEPAAAPAVADAVIEPASVEAPEYPISVTPPLDAFTTDKDKGWICAGLDGTFMTITLPAPMVISEIDVLPGIDGTAPDGSDLWAKHRIVTRVAFNLDYGDPVYGEFPDPSKRALQPTAMNNAITQTIRLVVLETKDVSAKGPTADAGTSTPPAAPGLLGDLGSLSLGPSQGSDGTAENARPATFAIGSIQIIGHTPA